MQFLKWLTRIFYRIRYCKPIPIKKVIPLHILDKRFYNYSPLDLPYDLLLQSSYVMYWLWAFGFSLEIFIDSHNAELFSYYQ